MTFLIETTYGVRRIVYAKGLETYDDAERMRETARTYGYSDAEIKREKPLRKKKRARARSEADPGGPGPKGG